MQDRVLSAVVAGSRTRESTESHLKRFSRSNTSCGETGYRERSCLVLIGVVASLPQICRSQRKWLSQSRWRCAETLSGALQDCVFGAVVADIRAIGLAAPRSLCGEKSQLEHVEA